VQICLIGLIRNTFRYASRCDWDVLAKDLRPVNTAPAKRLPQPSSPVRDRVAALLISRSRLPASFG
jgi:hypothetical protein